MYTPFNFPSYSENAAGGETKTRTRVRPQDLLFHKADMQSNKEVFVLIVERAENFTGVIIIRKRQCLIPRNAI